MNRIFALILCLVCLVGCATSPIKYQFSKMTQGEVGTFILYTNQLLSASQWEITSVTPYAVPTSKWVQDFVTPRLINYYFDNGLRRWIAGENDCVKFSTHAISEAYTVYSNEKNRLRLTTLAVGCFDYFSDSAKGHEIIFFIVNDNDGKGFKLRFYEPQQRSFINLSSDELLSCYHWRI